LTHAVEAYVSNANSPITDLHAMEAIRLVSHNLINAIKNPTDLLPRQEMMLASLHAGLAFSNASLGAVHAMAHSLGGLMGLPHGECNALLLEHVVAVNFEASPHRYQKISDIMDLALAAPNMEAQRACLLEGLADLRRRAGIEKSLGQLGVKPEFVPGLAAKAINDPCMATNPRPLNQADIEAIYNAAL